MRPKNDKFGFFVLLLTSSQFLQMSTSHIAVLMYSSARRAAGTNVGSPRWCSAPFVRCCYRRIIPHPIYVEI